MSSRTSQTKQGSGLSPLSPTSISPDARLVRPDGARGHAAASGGTPPLTPASQITAKDFRDAFHHNIVDRETFVNELGLNLAEFNKNTHPSVKIEGLQQACDDSKKDSDLRDFVKMWYDKFGTAVFKNKEPTSEAMLSGASRESNLKTVYGKYAMKIEGSKGGKLMEFPDDSRGSLVTSKSQQDVAFYVPRSNNLFEGEIKNNVKYDRESAIRQCAAYLYFQLWWFRTVQGRNVQTAYGFTICGPKCAGLSGEYKEIAVSLLILKVPKDDSGIGGNYELYDYPITHRITDEAPFDELGSLLMTKLPDPFESEYIFPAFVCPGCMLMSNVMLSDTRNEEDRGWELITTGTGSLVLRCKDTDTVLRLLKDHVGPLEVYWKEDLADVGDASTPLFLKCRTLASGKHWDSALSAILESRAHLGRWKRRANAEMREIAENWLEMYPMDPLIYKGRSIVVMKDMGKHFSGDLNYREFKVEMLNLCVRTLTVQNKVKLVHGDIHEGNVVFSSNVNVGWKLSLIDWDEAQKGLPLARKLLTPDQEARYPKLLTKHPELFTKNQFLCLFSKFHLIYEQRDGVAAWEGLPYDRALLSDKEQLPALVDTKYQELLEFLRSN